MKNGVSSHHVEGNWNAEKIAIRQATCVRAMPNVIMGRAMSDIPSGELAIVAEPPGEGDAEQMEAAPLRPAKHALLRDPHVNRDCPTYAEDGAHDEYLPEPDFTNASHSNGAQTAQRQR